MQKEFNAKTRRRNGAKILEFFGWNFPRLWVDPSPRLWYQIVVHKNGEPRYDTCWRKSRIAARILLREDAGKLTARDVVLGRKLATDRGVTPRLIDQAISGIRGKKHRLERERRAAA
jgi:hypothetical protein